jgi:Ca-activated chloride channel family protein
MLEINLQKILDITHKKLLSFLFYLLIFLKVKITSRRKGLFSTYQLFFNKKEICVTIILILFLLCPFFSYSLQEMQKKSLILSKPPEELNTKVLIRQTGLIQGNQRITVNVKDTGLYYVEFYIDATLVFTDKKPPWECVYDFGEKERIREIRAIGYYQSRESLKPEAQNIQKLLAAETESDELDVIITSPQTDSSIAGEILISADVSVPSGSEVEKVEFYIDKYLLFTVRKAPYECRCDVGMEFNRHVIEVVAYDSKKRKAKDAIVIKDWEGGLFEADVDLVNLDVTVTDNTGKYVPKLKRKDFIVYEDGKRQRISHFTRMEKPLVVGVLIDISGSMLGKKLEKAKIGAKKFINTLKENDNAFIMSFNHETKLIHDFTNSISELCHSIDNLQASSATALNKAIKNAIDKLKYERGRKAIVLISDGYDTIGNIDEEKVLEAAKRADVKIYSIGIFSLSYIPANTLRKIGTVQNKLVGQVILKSFSDWTGGAAFFPNSLNQLNEIYISIAQELRQQYSLGYLSSNKVRDGKWRNIEIKLKNENLRARTKKGYYAPQEQ